MPLANPTPISPGVADQLWITAITITPSQAIAVLSPWDGTHLVGNPSEMKRAVVSADELCGNILAAAAVLTGDTVTRARCLVVTSADPSRPITARLIYETGEAVPTEIDGQIVDVAPMATFSIDDLFALFAADAALAAYYQAILDALAGEVV